MKIYLPAGTHLRNVYRSETCFNREDEREDTNMYFMSNAISPLSLLSLSEKIKRHLEDKRYSVPSFPQSVRSRIF